MRPPAPPTLFCADSPVGLSAFFFESAVFLRLVKRIETGAFIIDVWTPRFRWENVIIYFASSKNSAVCGGGGGCYNGDYALLFLMMLNQSVNPRRIVVLGAGAAGVAAALRLQQLGWEVVLVDRCAAPASEASYGNAGIICSASAVPFTNPSLLSLLPKLLFTRHAALHYRLGYIAAQLGWVRAFLKNARSLESATQRAKCLLALIARGRALHEQWLAHCGLAHHTRRGGWLRAYRRHRSFAHSRVERELFDALNIPYRLLDADEVATRQPAFAPAVFARGILFSDGVSVMDPGAVVRAYASWFVSDGGRVLQAEAVDAQPTKTGWTITLRADDSKTDLSTAHVLVALGAWTPAFLKRLGLALPLVAERGAHRHFAHHAPPLPCAFADIDGGYNATQQGGCIRMTTGVYFAGLDAPPPCRQLQKAERNLRAALPALGDAVGEDWFGARPSLPDSLPVVGQTRLPRLWLASGGQHVGWMSAPAIGEIAAALINGESGGMDGVDAAAFTPARFGI